MDLSIYNFKELINESLIDAPKDLIEEAKKRTPRKGMDKFSELFYNGGELNFKDDVKGTWKEEMFLYARKLMKSWIPKHEHKEIVVGMIFEECLVL